MNRPPYISPEMWADIQAEAARIIAAIPPPTPEQRALIHELLPPITRQPTPPQKKASSHAHTPRQDRHTTRCA
jgi:hypothetical protein